MSDAVVRMDTGGYTSPDPRHHEAVGKEQGIQGVSHADVACCESEDGCGTPT